MGLKRLIERAIEEKWVRNEDFSRWKEQKEAFEQQLQIQRQFHADVGIPYDPPNAGAFQWDYVSMLLKSLPIMRNDSGKRDMSRFIPRISAMPR